MHNDDDEKKATEILIHFDPCKGAISKVSYVTDDGCTLEADMLKPDDQRKMDMKLKAVDATFTMFKLQKNPCYECLWTPWGCWLVPVPCPPQ